MFDDIIKNKADEHEAPVPPDAWDNIVKKKNKRRFAFWWWSGSLLLLLTISTISYFLLNSKKSDAVAAVDKNKEKQITNDQVNNKQGNKQQEGKTQVPLLQENTDAGNTATNNITIHGASSKKQNNTIEGKAKATITLSANEPGENNVPVAISNNKIKKIKGKLKVEQTMPGIDENLATNEKVKANIKSPVAEEDITAETGNEEGKQETIVTVPGKKNITIEEIKKTNATDSNQTEIAKQEQSNKEKTAVAKRKAKKHWFIEAAAVPLIASSHYNENIPFNRTLALNNGVSVYRANLKNASIEPAVAFSLLLRWEMSKKIDLGTGLQYMLLKENTSIEGKETKTTYAFVNRLVDGRLVPDTLATVTEGTRAIDAVNSYQLISIPVFVQYSMIQKPKWSVGAVGGFYLNISGNYKNEINRNAAAPLLPAPGTTNKSNIGVDLFAGIRIGKRLSKRLDLFAMPSMRWSLAKYNVKNSLLDKNINQAGVGFGLSFKMN